MQDVWQKIVVLLIVASAIGMTRLWRNTRPDPNASGTVVYATRDIAAGSMLRTADLDEGPLKYYQIPEDAVPGGTFAAGRIAKVEIKSGQMICLWQLKPLNACAHYPDYNAGVMREWAGAWPDSNRLGSVYNLVFIAYEPSLRDAAENRLGFAG